MNESVDVFLTSDQNLRYQQDLSNIRYRIIVLVAHDNRLLTLQPFMPQVQQAIPLMLPGSVIEIGMRED
nr:hypothetical protein [Candidatus Oscillochloris fontis]